MTLSNKQLLKRFIIKAALIFTIGIIMFGFVKTVKASVTKEYTREFHCKSILIEDNDSLWSLADKYYTNEYEDINHYIKVIMRANNLTGTTIHSGNYLIIPYYD